MDGAYEWLIERAQSSEVVAVALTFLIAALVRIFRRGRLAWSISHQHTFIVPPEAPPEQPGDEVVAPPVVLVIHTQDIWVQNTGHSPLSNVEVVLNYAPPHYEVWPQREFEAVRNPDDRLIIKVPSLGPREFFTIVMISREELPLVANVRSSEGVARRVRMGPQQILSRPFIELVRVLLFLGILAAVYIAVRLVQWIGSLA
jgi:hypothetical protein